MWFRSPRFFPGAMLSALVPCSRAMQREKDEKKKNWDHNWEDF